MVVIVPDIDPRLSKWPLMENATKVSLIVVSYLIFIKILGPAYMKNRKPYDLRKPMFLYNCAMVVYSAWMFYMFGKHGWFGKYSWLCEPVNYSVDEDAMGMVTVCWHFYISKFIELLDTVFFVLRKKDSQVTFLHVYHHSIVPLTAWFQISHGAAGFNTLFGFVNTFIHTWMYLYYALAALGSSIQKYLWWKKYLTTMQMVQFCIVIFGVTSNVIIPGCEPNMVLVISNLSQGVIFLVLFLVFYKAAYKKKKSTKNDDFSHKASVLPGNATTSDLRHRYQSEKDRTNGSLGDL